MSHGTTPPSPLILVADGPLGGEARVPGDKSISHRAIMLSALAVGRSEIRGLLEGEDVLATAAAMRAMGATVERLGPGHWIVDGVGVGGLLQPQAALDMGNSGTSTRLLMGLVASHPVTATFTGDESLSRRPMGRVIEPLGRMGADITASPGGRLPLILRGAETPLPIRYRLPVASAQVKSAILLAGLNIGAETVVEAALYHGRLRTDAGLAGGRRAAAAGRARHDPRPRLSGCAADRAGSALRGDGGGAEEPPCR